MPNQGEPSLRELLLAPEPRVELELPQRGRRRSWAPMQLAHQDDEPRLGKLQR